MALIPKSLIPISALKNTEMGAFIDLLSNGLNTDDDFMVHSQVHHVPTHKVMQRGYGDNITDESHHFKNDFRLTADPHHRWSTISGNQNATFYEVVGDMVRCFLLESFLIGHHSTKVELLADNVGGLDWLSESVEDIEGGKKEVRVMFQVNVDLSLYSTEEISKGEGTNLITVTLPLSVKGSITETIYPDVWAGEVGDARMYGGHIHNLEELSMKLKSYDFGIVNTTVVREDKYVEGNIEGG